MRKVESHKKNLWLAPLLPKEDSFYYAKNDQYVNNCIGTLLNKQGASVNNRDFQ